MYNYSKKEWKQHLSCLFHSVIKKKGGGRGAVLLTLWLDSPSRLAVVTKQVLSSRLDCRSIKSQGKVSSSSTSTTSPTCSKKQTQISFISLFSPSAEAPDQFWIWNRVSDSDLNNHSYSNFTTREPKDSKRNLHHGQIPIKLLWLICQQLPI